MKFYIDKKAHKIDIQSLKIINSGSEGNVFLYEGQALKLYTGNRQNIIGLPSLTIDRFDYLKEIKTNTFNFPTSYVLDKNGLLVGKISPLILNQIPIKKLLDIEINELLKIINDVFDDLDVLTNYKVLVNDINYNYIFNDIINMIDTDLYFLYNDSTGNILKKNIDYENIKRMNEFFVLNLIAYRLLNKKYSDLEISIISRKIIYHFFDDLRLSNKLEEYAIDTNSKTLREIIKNKKIYKKIKEF